MKVELQTSEATSSKLVITANTKDMEQTRKMVLRELSSKVKIAGFRPGKAPLELVAKEIDTQELYQAFLSRFVPQAVEQALDLKKIHPVSSPEVSLTKFVPYQDIEIKVTVFHLGEVRLADYKKMREKLPEIKVEPDEVEDIINKIRLDFAEFKQVDRVVAKGDQVWINFIGKDQQGEEIPGAQADDYSLVIGSKSFIEGFEDKIIGHKKGDHLNFQLNFPKDYTPALAGKKVDFSVDINKVESVKLPPLDKDLFAKVGPFQTLAELTQFIKQRILDEKQERVLEVFQGQIVAKLAKASKIEIPQKLIDTEIEKVKEEHQQSLDDNQLTLDQWLKDTKSDLKKHQAQLKEVALNRLNGGLVLREIAKAEQISVTDEEVDKLYNHKLAEKLDVDKQFDLKQDLKARLLTQKTLSRLSQIILGDENSPKTSPAK